MTSLDWSTIGTIATTVAVVMSGFLWLVSRIFNLGKTSQRLDSLETDLADFKTEVRGEFKAVRGQLRELENGVNRRMDKLILTIADSKTK